MISSAVGQTIFSVTRIRAMPPDLDSRDRSVAFEASQGSRHDGRAVRILVASSRTMVGCYPRPIASPAQSGLRVPGSVTLTTCQLSAPKWVVSSAEGHVLPRAAQPQRGGQALAWGQAVMAPPKAWHTVPSLTQRSSHSKITHVQGEQSEPFRVWALMWLPDHIIPHASDACFADKDPPHVHTPHQLDQAIYLATSKGNKFRHRLPYIHSPISSAFMSNLPTHRICALTSS